MGGGHRWGGRRAVTVPLSATVTGSGGLTRPSPRQWGQGWVWAGRPPALPPPGDSEDEDRAAAGGGGGRDRAAAAAEAFPPHTPNPLHAPAPAIPPATPETPSRKCRRLEGSGPPPQQYTGGAGVAAVRRGPLRPLRGSRDLQRVPPPSAPAPPLGGLSAAGAGQGAAPDPRVRGRHRGDWVNGGGVRAPARRRPVGGGGGASGCARRAPRPPRCPLRSEASAAGSCPAAGRPAGIGGPPRPLGQGAPVKLILYAFTRSFIARAQLSCYILETSASMNFDQKIACLTNLAFRRTELARGEARA